MRYTVVTTRNTFKVDSGEYTDLALAKGRAIEMASRESRYADIPLDLDLVFAINTAGPGVFRTFKVSDKSSIRMEARD